MEKKKRLQPRLFAPGTRASATFAKTPREQEEAMQRAMEKVRLSLTQQTDATRALAKQWREQEEAVRQVLEKWRRPLTSGTDAMRTLTQVLSEQRAGSQWVAHRIKSALNPRTDVARTLTQALFEQRAESQRAAQRIQLWLTSRTDPMRTLGRELREQEEARKRTAEKIRLALTPKTDVIRTWVRRWRGQEEAMRQMLERTRQSVFEATDIVEFYAKELPRREPVVRASEKLQPSRSKRTNNNQGLSLIFDTSPQRENTRIVFKHGDQQITIIEPTKSAYEIDGRRNVGSLVEIVQKRLRSCIETAMYKQFGLDWEERIPRKVRGRCERHRNWHASAVSTPNSLLAYAAFNDLCAIICSDESWDKVFQKFFLEREFIQGSLCWFKKIRDSAAHGHSISEDEQQRLLVEAKYILGVLKEIRKIIRVSVISSG